MYWIISLILAFTVSATANDTVSKNNFSNDKVLQKNSIQDETERFSQTYPFNSNGTISVSDINGSVTIEAWDSQQIQLEYVKVASNRERLADVDVKIDAGLDTFRVETDYKRKDGKWDWNKNGKLYVKFNLKVPRGAALNKIKTVNGSIAISGMENEVNASTVNGGVVAKSLRGPLRISSVNGTVKAELTDLGIGNDVKLSTVNGTVNLYLPASIDAAFKASTVNGSIKNDFGLEVVKRKYSSGSSLNGTLGSGSSKVRLSSVNGTIDIKRVGAL